MGDLLAEGFPCQAARHHHIERLFRLADGAHAVMDAARPETDLRDLKAPAFAEQDVVFGHPDIVEAPMHGAARRMVAPGQVPRTEVLDPPGGLRYHVLLRV